MYLPGYAAKLLINTARLPFSSIDCSEMVDNIRTTNSEAWGAPVGYNQPGVHTSINGNGVWQATINLPSFDPLLNHYLAPFTVGAGLFVSLQIYLNGIGSVSWFVPSFHILETGQRIDSQGTTGMPPYLRGEGNGNWVRPFI
jgi:hypothetical protein